MNDTFFEGLQKKGKLTIILISVVAFVLLTLFILASFFDLQISEALYGYTNGFGKLYSNSFFIIGYLPAILVNTFLFACLFWYVKKPWLRVIIGFVIYSHLFGAGYVTASGIETSMNTEFSTPITMGIAGGIATLGTFPSIWFLRKVDIDTLKKMIYVCLICVIFASLANGTVALLQMIWGRDRYYFIIDGIMKDGALVHGIYTPWYQPTGNASEMATQSFPSLHTSSAVSFIFLPMLAWKLNFKKYVQRILLGVGLTGLISVPLSRIVMGHHFTSDVLFSLIISAVFVLTAIIAFDLLYIRRREKTATNPETTVS